MQTRLMSILEVPSLTMTIILILVVCLVGMAIMTPGFMTIIIGATVGTIRGIMVGMATGMTRGIMAMQAGTALGTMSTTVGDGLIDMDGTAGIIHIGAVAIM